VSLFTTPMLIPEESEILFLSEGELKFVRFLVRIAKKDKSTPCKKIQFYKDNTEDIAPLPFVTRQ